MDRGRDNPGSRSLKSRDGPTVLRGEQKEDKNLLRSDDKLNEIILKWSVLAGIADITTIPLA